MLLPTDWMTPSITMLLDGPHRTTTGYGRTRLMNPNLKRQSPHTSDEDRGGQRTGAQRRHRTAQQKEQNCSIEDDEHGHLIYKTGDVLQDRCTYLHSLPFHFILSSSILSVSDSRLVQQFGHGNILALLFIFPHFALSSFAMGHLDSFV